MRPSQIGDWSCAQASWKLFARFCGVMYPIARSGPSARASRVLQDPTPTLTWPFWATSHCRFWSGRSWPRSSPNPTALQGGYCRLGHHLRTISPDHRIGIRCAAARPDGRRSEETGRNQPQAPAQGGRTVKVIGGTMKAVEGLCEKLEALGYGV